MLKLDNTHFTMELEGNQLSQFHYVWLRDNCSCELCTHPDTKERILVTSTIPEDIAPKSADIVGNKLVIVWNHEEHQSRYDLAWLQQHNYSHSQIRMNNVEGNQVLWGKELEPNIPRFDYQEVRHNDQALLDWCMALRDYGLTITSNVPQEEGEVERFATYVAVVRDTIYDRLHNVKATPGEYNAYNVASTTLELKPHTDMPNYNNPPGVQMFHFLVNESIGGESTAVDGFKVAAQLQDEDPEAFDILASTPVHFRMFSSRGDIESSNPLLTLDTNGKLKVFRFSNQLAQTSMIPAEQMEAFYRAYRKLGQLVEAPENKIQFRLNTGDMMATNNLRVMHGRNAYNPNTGGRHLQLSYMDMDDVLSRIRMILKKQ